MNRRYLGTIGVVFVLLALVCAASAATQHYALATSSTSLYILRTDTTAGAWGGRSWWQFDTSFGSTGITGVATYGNYVFVVDGTNSSLYVGRIDNILTSPTLNTVTTISLYPSSGSLHVQSPTAVVAYRDSGSYGAYVIGSTYDSYSHSCFAHISAAYGDWTQATVKYGDLSGKPMADIALVDGTNALIAHQGPESPGQAWVSEADGSSLLTYGSNPLGNGCYTPQAIAVNDTLGYAYVVNRAYDSTLAMGSLQTYNPSTHQTKDAIALGTGMIPNDVVTFSVGDAQYLGIIGKNGSTDEAWKIRLNGGTPDVAGRISSSSVSSSTQHKAAASADGDVLWFTSWATGTVEAWNTSTWSSIAGFSASLGEGANVKYIADFNPDYVPEPSSVVSLAAMAGALLGCRKRKSRDS